jgi:hypothetical protein
MSELEPLSAIADQVLDRLFAQIEENEKNFPGPDVKGPDTTGCTCSQKGKK